MEIRKLLALGLVLVLLAVWTLGVGAEAGVTISPARLEATVGSDGRAPGLQVSNRGSEWVVVRFSLVGGSHDLDGSPVFDESPGAQESWIGRAFLEPSEVRLGPGETAMVSLHVVPEPGQGMYPVIMADIRPLEEKGAMVTTYARVAVPVLLTFSRAEAIVSASEVTVSQQRPGGAIHFAGVLHNAGPVHVRAGARAVITGPDTHAEVLIEPVTILPGAARRVRAEWIPDSLPSGSYSVHLIPEGIRGIQGETEVAVFHVLRPYEVALVRPSLESFAVRAAAGPHLLVEALVTNQGNVAGEARLVVEVRDTQGCEMGYREWYMDALAPRSGRAVTGKVAIAEYRAEEYLVTASLWHDSRQVEARQHLVRLSLPALAVR